MQMVALSRNTASVAQDFHNAGGGYKQQQSIEQQAKKLFNKIKSEYQENHEAANLTVPSTINSAALQYSPPATSNPIKRRRRSSHDKENTNLGCFDRKSIDFTGIERHMKEVITRLYMDPFNIGLTTATTLDHTSKTETENITFNDISSVQDYLKNNKELTISIEPRKNLNNNLIDKITVEPINLVSEKSRNRKQAQPRKIEKTESTLTSIRDKHLIRLISRKKHCRICQKNPDSILLSYQRKVSLIFHTKWRHSTKRYKCRCCKEKFNQKYKLVLHKKIKHKK